MPPPRLERFSSSCPRPAPPTSPPPSQVPAQGLLARPAAQGGALRHPHPGQQGHAAEVGGGGKAAAGRGGPGVRGRGEGSNRRRGDAWKGGRACDGHVVGGYSTMPKMTLIRGLGWVCKQGMAPRRWVPTSASCLASRSTCPRRSVDCVLPRLGFAFRPGSHRRTTAQH